MKNFKYFVVVAGASLILALSGGHALAQGGFGGGAGGGGGGFGGGGGGFDPSQLFQMIVDGQRESLSVTNDDEWKAISPRLLKVVQLQMQARTVGMGAMFGGMRGGGGGGVQRRMGGLGGEPDPAETALTTALENHASTPEIKTALAKVRAVRQAKKDELLKAQSDLRDLLTPRQEALLVAGGMLD
jgi:hypothetical protein